MKKLVLIIFFTNLCLFAQQNSTKHRACFEPITTEEEHEFLQDFFRSNNLSNSLPANTVTTWTKPLIIDNNNHDFDNKSIFQFTENIIYKPAQNYVYPYIYQGYGAAIIINKDNITIDLSGYTLALDGSSSTNFSVNNPTYGISIMPGIKNTKIISTRVDQPTRPGCITGFSGYGIYALGEILPLNSYDPFQNLIKNLIIDNLIISQNISGIYVGYALAVSVTNTNVLYNISPRTNYGIYFSNVTEGIIHQSQSNHNWSYKNMYSVLFENTIGAVAKDSTMNMNRSLKTGSVYGVAITQHSNLNSYVNQIISCSANSNLSSFAGNQESVGFLISGVSSRNIVNNCESLVSGHVTGVTPSTNPEGIGIKLEHGTYVNQIRENKTGFHTTGGIVDTNPISTNFFSNNFSFFNTLNYDVRVPDGGTGSVPLPTVLVFQDNINDFLAGTSPIFANFDVRSRG